MSLGLFTRKEVFLKLSSVENTSPGPAAITYVNWSSVDPEAAVLTLLLNICLDYKRIPQEWKKATTVLIPKKKTPLVDVRPITLMDTARKLFEMPHTVS